jgi:hypothetical protein
MAWFRTVGITEDKDELHGSHAVHRDCMEYVERGLPSGVVLVRTSTLPPDEACVYCGGTVQEHYDELAKRAVARHGDLGRRGDAGVVVLHRVMADAVKAAQGQLTPGLDTAEDRLIDLCESARVLQAVLEHEPFGRAVVLRATPVTLGALVRLAQWDGALDDKFGAEACRALHHTCEILMGLAS